MLVLAGFRPNLAPRLVPTGRAQKRCRTHPTLAPETNSKAMPWQFPGLGQTTQILNDGMIASKKLLRMRPEIFDSGPERNLNRSQTKPQITGTVPTDRHITIPKASGPMSACFDEDPKLVKCETAQPRPGSFELYATSLMRRCAEIQACRGNAGV